MPQGPPLTAPELQAVGCPASNEDLSVVVRHGGANGLAVVAIGASTTSTPLGAGCDLLVAPPFVVSPPFTLHNTGALAIPLHLPLMPAGVHVVIQAFVFDGASSVGFKSTNAVGFSAL